MISQLIQNLLEGLKPAYFRQIIMEFKTIGHKILLFPMLKGMFNLFHHSGQSLDILIRCILGSASCNITFEHTANLKDLFNLFDSY
ncbi:hypothetical protein D3C73_1535920 [compost metagenome]